MRGWIILDSLMMLVGFVWMTTGRQSFGSAFGICAIGVLLLTLTLGARLLRGRA